jgi:AmmeMemoRadiSam system protein A
LRRDGQLRGCIGTLEAYRPLCIDIAGNACAAAFHDPRFSPLRPPELEALMLEISVLSPPEPLEFGDARELCGRLRPGVDGLILEADGRSGTFLPGVWDSLPEPRDFLHHLKLKAGLPGDYRLDTVKVWRYTTECFGEARC